MTACHSTRAAAPQCGFTLIEMMLAITMGTLVIYVAMAGIRTLSQSITAANRLALENGIIRTGVTIALENSDFWLDHDLPHPLDVALDQPLRGTALDNATPTPAERGLPFTPFADSQAVTGYRTPSASSPSIPAPTGVSQIVLNGLNENASGWDPNAWHPAEARGWNWGNLVERTPRHSGPSNRTVPTLKYKIFGHYDSVASTDPTLSTHHWQQRQMDGLLRSLGSYGLFDYLPANTGLMIYQKISSTDMNENGRWMVSPEWCRPDGGPYYRLASDGNLSFALDRLADTWGQVFMVPNRGIPTADRSRASNRRYNTGIAIQAANNDAAADDIKRLLLDGEQVDFVLRDSNASGPANKPAHWPSLTVRNLRFIRTGAFINLNRIEWTNPLTGLGAELSFTCFGTSLRGARQQRLRDEPGWADPFPLTGSPKPTLDSY